MSKGCGHTAEEHQAFIRDLLRKKDPDAWARLENFVIASEPWVPMDPRPASLPVTTFPRIDDDAADEQEWMNEIRTARYRELGI